MRKFLLSFLLISLFLFSCTNKELFTHYYPFFTNAFKTNNSRELLVAGYNDTIYLKDNQPVKSAYFAVVKGQFEHVMDTIVQYGHCWSFGNDTIPKITSDTTKYTRFYNWQFDSVGIYTSYIPLYPETPFNVRSYIITAGGDTGYLPFVYKDTALPPINEWFNNENLVSPPNLFREGACCFTVSNGSSTKIFVACGNDQNNVYGDIYEYNPQTYKWNLIWSDNDLKRTEGVGFGLYETDIYGRTQLYLYIGLGRNTDTTQYFNDFYRIPYAHPEQMQRITDFPEPLISSTAFTIGDKAYVGLGRVIYNHNDVAQFYLYDYKEFMNGNNPWKAVKPDFPGGLRENAVVFVINNIAFIGTGYNTSTKTYYNDLWALVSTNSNGSGANWVGRSPLPANPRSEAVGFSLDFNGYIGLGFDGSNYYKDFYRYDPYIDYWYTNIVDYKIGPDIAQGDEQLLKNAIAFGVTVKDGNNYKKMGFVGLGRFPSGYYSNEFWFYRPW